VAASVYVSTFQGEGPSERDLVALPVGRVSTFRGDERRESDVVRVRAGARRVDFVALGGDRDAINEALEANQELGWLSERAIPRLFTVPEPHRRVLGRLPYDSTRPSS
jgi:hypothetical protein